MSRRSFSEGGLLVHHVYVLVYVLASENQPGAQGNARVPKGYTLISGLSCPEPVLTGAVPAR